MNGLTSIATTAAAATSLPVKANPTQTEANKISPVSEEALKTTASENNVLVKELTPSRIDYPHVLRDLIYAYSDKAKRSLDDTKPEESPLISFNPFFEPPAIAAKTITTSTAASVTSTSDEAIAKEKQTAKNKLSEEKQKAKKNLIHDLEIQKSLLLKEYPRLKGYVAEMSEKGFPLKVQVLLLRRRIYEIENPEYLLAMQAWQRQGVSLEQQLMRLQLLKEYAFGSAKWEKYFGTIEGKIPELPADIFEILFKLDPITPDKKTLDTHVLVLVPKTVNVEGKSTEISLKTLGELVQEPKNDGNPTQYSGTVYAREHETAPVEDSHWVLMRKEVLPESTSKSYPVQKKMVEEEYSKKAGVQHFLPNAVDAAACCFLTYVSTGIRLFDTVKDLRYIHLMYIRCQEQVNGEYPVIVGGFSPRGLYVDISDSDEDHNDGVVAARKF